MKRFLVAITILCLICPAWAGANAALPASVGTSRQPAPAGWWRQASAAIEASEYHVSRMADPDRPGAGTRWQAPNRAHGLRIFFLEEGLRIVPRKSTDGNWSLELRPQIPTMDGSPRTGQRAEPRVREYRVEYSRAGLEERYENSRAGLSLTYGLPVPCRVNPVDPPTARELHLELGGDLDVYPTQDPACLELAAPGGQRVLRLGPFTAQDERGAKLPVSLRVLGREVIIAVKPEDPAVPVTLLGLATSYSWSYESNAVQANLGYAVNTAGDVNGDGYSDVLVGAPYYDFADTDDGVVFVFHGSATGLSSAWSSRLNYGGEDSGFGSYVHPAGDVNGDGYADVLVSALLYDNGQENEGGVFLYLGSAAGLGSSPAWHVEGGQVHANLKALGTAGDVNGDGYSDVVVAASLYDTPSVDAGMVWVYHGSSAGLSTTSAWSTSPAVADMGFGTGGGTAGDVNRDGYSDIIVSASRCSNGQSNEGAAWVYLGSADGLEIFADWHHESDMAFAYYGSGASTAGDVNGDGYSDIVVGAPGYGNGQLREGAVYLYPGSSGGVLDAAVWQWESNVAEASFGETAAAGDVNGDGFADFLVSPGMWGVDADGEVCVFHGSATGPGGAPDWIRPAVQAGSWYGYGTGTAGDVNGDGYSDVIVGAPAYTNGQDDEGAAYLYKGGPTGLGLASGWSYESPQVGAEMGFSVGTAGDVNGDGYADVIVGAPYFDHGESDEGEVFVFHGSSVGLNTAFDWSRDSSHAGAHFGISVGTAGDVNGDGYDDVIVGAHKDTNGQSEEGRAYVYHGSSTGLATGAAWISESNQSGSEYGISVGTAGDVNGDGFSDVIVGASEYTHGQDLEGRAFVYHGGPTGLSASAAWTTESDQAYAYLGFCVSTAGDVNADGYSDVVVGASSYDNGDLNEGRAYAFLGSPAGLSGTPIWNAESGQAQAHFGISVAAAGDVNGDGYGDILVGAYLYDLGETNEGAAFLYLGRSTGLHSSAAWVYDSDQEGAHLGRRVACAGDVNGDGFADAVIGAPDYDNGQTDEGRVYVFHGSLSDFGGTPARTLESNIADSGFGFAAGTAGDVNGDGFADVVVGAYNTVDGGYARLYYGNSGPGLSMRPRQWRVSGTGPVARLGAARSVSQFRAYMNRRSPIGRDRVKLEVEAKPLGEPFTGADTAVSTSWTAITTPGAAHSLTVGGLPDNTPVHWRARLLYYPGNILGLTAGRWIHIPWNGWTETRFTTNRRGDLDQDCDLDAVDLTILIQYLAGHLDPGEAPYTAEEAAADLDLDGLENADDLALLAQWLAGNL